jgi:ketosteroid isomerase-like protein
MSANLDLVRSIYAAWERCDWSSVEWAHPEIEFVIPDGPSPNTMWTGLSGMAQGMRDLLSAWEDFRVAAEEYRELDGERVLVLGHNTGRGKGSGLKLGQVRTRGACLFHLRSGKVIRVSPYFNRENAFADLGLAPETDKADRPS